MKKLQHSTDYRVHRAGAYPPHGDALDAIAKGFRALMEQGFSPPPETEDWLKRCEAVKTRFRKAPRPPGDPT